MKNPEQTRNHIIEVAAPVFNRLGYIGTSLSDILEKTTLTKGAIYHYFENKDELALEALEYNLRLAWEINFKAIIKKDHSCDKLSEFAESFRKNFISMKQMGGCPVVNAAIDSDDVNEQIKGRICRFIKMWEKAISDIVEEGKLKAEINPGTDAKKFSMNFISIIEGSLAMSKVSDNRKFLDNAVELIKSLIDDIRI